MPAIGMLAKLAFDRFLGSNLLIFFCFFGAIYKPWPQLHYLTLYTRTSRGRHLALASTNHNQQSKADTQHDQTYWETGPSPFAAAHPQLIGANDVGHIPWDQHPPRNQQREQRHLRAFETNLVKLDCHQGRVVERC